MLLFPFISAQGQEDWGCKKPSKKAAKLFEVAQQYGFKNKKGYEYLIEAKKEDPSCAQFLYILASLNVDKGKTGIAASYFEQLREACPEFRNHEATFWLAKEAYQAKKYEEAESLLADYLAKAKMIRPNSIKEAQDFQNRISAYREIFNNPVPFDPIKVDGPSTGDDEYLPMLSPDNQFLFFTRKTEVDSKSAFGSQEKELFIQSRKQYDGSYSTGIPMPTPFNAGSYQGGSTISIDNKLLFITIVSPVKTRDGRGFSNGDIYYSEFKGGQWSDLKSIGEHINGRFTWEGQPSISADNKTLYFASAREEGQGMDLYKTQRQANGSWGPAISLGPTINTPGNEKSPFIHSDSYTLYFSSDGHPGVGGQDIFFARINDFGKFDPPTNIGVPINTEKDEHGFMVSTDGAYGYFSSNPENKGLDIYRFELPVYARPEEVSFVKGSISSKDPDAAKGMTVELKNTSTDEVIEGVVDEETGDYVAVIAARKSHDVMLMAKKDGYAFTSQYINSDEDVVGKPMRAAPMEFNPIEEGETYQINNVNFDTDSYALNQQVANILNEFIVFLKDNPSIKVAIHGHTDSVGDDVKNLILSQNRAKAVYQYLILEDIMPSRLQYEGFGEAKPIATNDTEEGRRKNRRTEFVILSK